MHVSCSRQTPATKELCYWIKNFEGTLQQLRAAVAWWETPPPSVVNPPPPPFLWNRPRLHGRLVTQSERKKKVCLSVCLSHLCCPEATQFVEKYNWRPFNKKEASFPLDVIGNNKLRWNRLLSLSFFAKHFCAQCCQTICSLDASSGKVEQKVSFVIVKFNHLQT